LRHSRPRQFRVQQSSLRRSADRRRAPSLLITVHQAAFTLL
jgi:hypothetical protein